MLLIECVYYHQTEPAALTSLISTVFQLMIWHFSLSSLHVYTKRQQTFSQISVACGCAALNSRIYGKIFYFSRSIRFTEWWTYLHIQKKEQLQQKTKNKKSFYCCTLSYLRMNPNLPFFICTHAHFFSVLYHHPSSQVYCSYCSLVLYGLN